MPTRGNDPPFFAVDFHSLSNVEGWGASNDVGDEIGFTHCLNIQMLNKIKTTMLAARRESETQGEPCRPVSPPPIIDFLQDVELEDQLFVSE